MDGKETAEILKVVQMYVDGCAKGDGELMSHAFHSSATINGAPIKTLFDGATKAGPCDCKAKVEVVQIVNDIAVVRVDLANYFGVNYIDFHAMKKTEEGWKIMAKIFTEDKD